MSILEKLTSGQPLLFSRLSTTVWMYRDLSCYVSRLLRAKSEILHWKTAVRIRICKSLTKKKSEFRISQKICSRCICNPACVLLPFICRRELDPVFLWIVEELNPVPGQQSITDKEPPHPACTETKVQKKTPKKTIFTQKENAQTLQIVSICPDQDVNQWPFTVKIVLNKSAVSYKEWWMELWVFCFLQICIQK